MSQKLNRRELLSNILGCAIAAPMVSYGAFKLTDGVIKSIAPRNEYPGKIFRANCVNNPYDVRIYADEIMSAANWIIERIPEETPLVILMGEHHDRPAHKISNLAVLKACKEQGFNTSFGLEVRHDILRINNNQNIYSFAKTIENGSKNFRWSSESYSLAIQYALKNAITVDFNDVAKGSYKKHSIMTQHDAWNRYLIQKYAPQHLDKIIYRSSSTEDSRLGMKLSNLSMFEFAESRLLETKSKIYIQQCGLAHVSGDSYFNYEDSLCAIHQAAGHAVLSCSPSHYRFSTQTPETNYLVQAIGMNQTSTELDNDHKAVLQKINKATDGMVYRR